MLKMKQNGFLALTFLVFSLSLSELAIAEQSDWTCGQCMRDADYPSYSFKFFYKGQLDHKSPSYIAPSDCQRFRDQFPYCTSSVPTTPDTGWSCTDCESVSGGYYYGYTYRYKGLLYGRSADHNSPAACLLAHEKDSICKGTPPKLD